MCGTKIIVPGVIMPMWALPLHLFPGLAFGCVNVAYWGSLWLISGEVFDYLVAHGRMKEKEARVKFRQVCTYTRKIGSS